MSRGLWFGAGAAAGAYGIVRAKRLLEVFTVDGLRDRVGAAVVGARMFRDEVAQGAADAETQLRERYAVASAGRHAAVGAPTTTRRALPRGADARGDTLTHLTDNSDPHDTAVSHQKGSDR